MLCSDKLACEHNNKKTLKFSIVRVYLKTNLILHTYVVPYYFMMYT